MKLTKVKDLSLPTGVLGLACTADGAATLRRLHGRAHCTNGPETGTWSRLPTQHSSFASGCVLLPDGKTVISAGYDGWLLWHDVDSKQCFRRVQAHEFWSWQLALSADGRRVASVTGQYLVGGEKYEPAPIAGANGKDLRRAHGRPRAHRSITCRPC